jgi:hypothetical protein
MPVYFQGTNIVDLIYEKYFDYFIIGSLVWVGVGIIASVLYRAKNRKHFPNLQDGILKFHERWVSGRSMKNIFTQLGGARNGLDVKVGGGHLTVRPIFPLNLMFLPEVMDLEPVIPLASVKEVNVISSFGRKGVSVRYDRGDRLERSVELYPRDIEFFLESVSRTV